MPEPITPVLTVAQNAYLGGIIDGEGYIGICKTTETSYLLRVVVTTTSRELVDWIQTTTGLGKIKERDLSSRNRQNIFEWKVFGRQAGTLLKAVVPYLLVKKAQAIIGLRYQNNAALSGPEKVEFAKQCASSLRLLNLREGWKQNVASPPASTDDA